MSAPLAGRSRRLAIAVGVIAVTTIISIALRWAVPINPIGLKLAGLDGGLFERLAISLTQQNWLGKFDTATLAKGPGYPIFISAMHRLHLPLQVGEQIAYLLGSLALAGCVFAITRKPLAAALVYVVMAFDPVNYSSLSTAVIRENVYTGFSLLFICGFFLAVYGALYFRKTWWALGAAALGGFGGAAFWLCREEGVWIAASLAFILGALVVLRVVSPRVTDKKWIARRDLASLGARLVLTLAVVGAAFYAPVKVVHMKNAKQFGSGLATDFAGGNFPKAYATWGRIRGVTLRRYVPINTEQRRAAYAVSPTAKILEPILEDPNNGSKQWACPANAIAARNGNEGLNICDDYPGGIEPWALRDATFFSGNFDNEPEFQEFWGKVEKEISHACDTGAVHCARKLPGALQLMQRAHPKEVGRSVWKWLRLVPKDPAVLPLYTTAAVNKVDPGERAALATTIVNSPKTQSDAVAAAELFASRRWIFNALAALYRWLFPILIVASLAGLVIGAVSKQNRPGPWVTAVLIAAFGGAVLVRLVMFAVIDTTQYFNEMRYQIATRSFLLALVSLGAVSALDQLWVRRVTASVAQKMPWRKSAPGSV